MQPTETDSIDYRERLRSLSLAKRELVVRSIGEVLSERGDSASSPLRIVAYVVTNTATVSDLRHYLNSKLPKHMSPASFVLVDELPRMSNGKVDRRQLSKFQPDLIEEREGTTSPKTPPRNEIEKVLMEIWCEVLDQSELCIHDNFYEVGGDSLRSIRILAIAHQRGLYLSPEHFFDHPTIAGQSKLAASVREHDGVVASNKLEATEGQSSVVSQGSRDLTGESPKLVDLDQAEMEKIASIFQDNDDSKL